MTVIPSEYNGFCNGVKRSLMLLDKALEMHRPIFLTDQIVHNNIVSKEYEKRGVKYLTSEIDISTLPKNCLVLISAHGYPFSKLEKLNKQHIEIIDTTCPLVKLRETEIRTQIKNGDIILLFIKNKEHSEVKFLTDDFKYSNLITVSSDLELGKFIETYKYKINAVYIHTQTTFPKEKEVEFITLLKKNFNRVELLSSICPNCLERQIDVKTHTKDNVEAVVVVGSNHSSNANELKRIAIENNKRGFVVESANNIPDELYKFKNVYMISSASSSAETFKSIFSCLSKNK